MKNESKNIMNIVLGIFLLSAGVNVFYIPNELISGGVSGLGIIIMYYSEKYAGYPIPVYVTNLVLNLPLFLAAYIRFGSKYIKRSIFAALLFSLVLGLTERLPQYSGDIMLAAVFGGILTGAGVGLIFNGAATTGGTETAAHILHDMSGRFSVSDYVFIIDALVIAVGFFAFGAEKTMYSVLSVFTASRCIAAVVSGRSADKAAIVISDKTYIIDKIFSEGDLPVLRIFRLGYQENKIGPMICVFSQNEVNMFRETIKSVDEDAFIILFDIKEIYGKGFKNL